MDLFSAEGSASGGAVIERLGVGPLIVGEGFPPLVLTTGSEPTPDVGLGRGKP